VVTALAGGDQSAARMGMEHSGQGLTSARLRCAKQAGGYGAPAACRSVARGLAVELLPQGVEEAAHALSSPGW
jgi:hypothetical protein